MGRNLLHPLNMALDSSDHGLGEMIGPGEQSNTGNNPRPPAAVGTHPFVAN